MHRTLVADDVGNPVIGRLPAPPCQLECRNSVATAQQVVTLNQAFQLPCRGCVAEGIMCQRSFIDEACPPCAGRHLQCLTDYTTDESQMQTNTGPPPVIDGPVDPAANIRRMMENLFQEHHKVLIDMYRSKDAKDVMSLLDLQIELSSLRPALEGYNNVALWEFWIRNMRKVSGPIFLFMKIQPTCCVYHSDSCLLRYRFLLGMARLQLKGEPRQNPDTPGDSHTVGCARMCPRTPFYFEVSGSRLPRYFLG